MSTLSGVSWCYRWNGKERYKSKVHFIAPGSSMLETRTLCGIKVDRDPAKRGSFVTTYNISPLDVHCGKCLAVTGVRAKMKLYRAYCAALFGKESEK